MLRPMGKLLWCEVGYADARSSYSQWGRRGVMCKARLWQSKSQSLTIKLLDYSRVLVPVSCYIPEIEPEHFDYR